MYKKLGLTSEEVCEVGKWKNVNAFTAHYSRLGASTRASGKILDLVHNVSPMQRAESDWSRTPWKNDKGGMDQEDEAQSIGEPTHPPLIQNAEFPFEDPLGMAAHPVPFDVSHSIDQEQTTDMASSSTSIAFCASTPLSPQPRARARTSKFFKRTRDAGDSPPKKFQFAHSKKGKEKQD